MKVRVHIRVIQILLHGECGSKILMKKRDGKIWSVTVKVHRGLGAESLEGTNEHQ